MIDYTNLEQTRAAAVRVYFLLEIKTVGISEIVALLEMIRAVSRALRVVPVVIVIIMLF